jgi:hypothetical protein
MENFWNTFSLSDGNSWNVHYDQSKNYGHNFISFLNRAIALPHEKIIEKILASYVLVNSKASKVLPILWIQGKSGTGKSLLSYLIAAYRGNAANILSSTSTFAGIRNQLQHLRWYRQSAPLNTSLQNEKPYLLVWSDIKEESITKNLDNMYALFRNGCYRAEEKIVISEGNGKNLPFYVFGQKVVSTTETFISNPKWAELYRRILPVKTVHYQELEPRYLEQYNNRDLLDLYCIDWDGISEEYNKHWDYARLTSIQQCYKDKQKIVKTAKKLGITDHQISISFDVVIAGYVSDLFNNLEDCLAVWALYWELAVNQIKQGEHMDISKIVIEVVTEESEQQIKIMKQLEKIGRLDLIEPIKIPPKIIKQAIKNAYDAGVIGEYKNKDINQCMEELGFTLTKINKEYYWVKT